LKYCAFVGELLIMHIVLASLRSRWWQHVILRDLQHSCKAAEVIGSRKNYSYIHDSSTYLTSYHFLQNGQRIFPTKIPFTKTINNAKG